MSMQREGSLLKQDVTSGIDSFTDIELSSLTSYASIFSKLQSTTTTSYSAQQSISTSEKSKETTPLASKSVSTMTSQFSSTLTPSVTFLTTPVIAECENGGLYIDNMCICLNHFTGARCEIAPIFAEQAIVEDAEAINMQNSLHGSSPSSLPELKKFNEIEILNKLLNSTNTSITTKSININSTNVISTTTKSINTITIGLNSEVVSLEPTIIRDQVGFDSENELVPVFTLSRYNVRNKNVTAHRSVYWPWFGRHFPHTAIDLELMFLEICHKF